MKKGLLLNTIDITKIKVMDLKKLILSESIKVIDVSINSYSYVKKINSANVKFNFWFSSKELNDIYFDITSSNIALRNIAISRVLARIEKSLCKNVKSICFPAPSPKGYHYDELLALQASLFTIADYLDNLNINVLFEPFDTNVHKCRILGSIDDTVSLLSHENIKLIWDSSHAYLNNDDFSKVHFYKDKIDSIHMSNCEKFTPSKRPTDSHILLFNSGILDKSIYLRILRQTTKKQYVYIEVNPNLFTNISLYLDYCINILKEEK